MEAFEKFGAGRGFGWAEGSEEAEVVGGATGDVDWLEVSVMSAEAEVVG